jgi:hypothetical protein
MRNFRSFAIVFATLLLAAAASAGVVYTATTSAEGQKGAEMQASKVKGWVAGDNAKVEFETSGNPMMPQGSYMVTTDGGKTLKLVKPKEKTYSTLDMDSMMGMAGGMMKMMNFKFTDPKVEKLAEEPDGLVAGIPTIYYKFRTSYAMEMKFMGMKQASTTVKEEEIWSAPKLIENALGIWLRRTPPKTGSEELDKLVAAEMGKIEGFPLKRVTVSTQTDKKGKSQTTKVTMEVTSLEMSIVPDSTFAIPAGFQEAPLMPMGESDKEGEDNPLTKMFGSGKKN